MTTILLLLFTGALSAYGFKPLFPHTISIIPFISFAYLFHQLNKSKPQKAFFYAFIFSIAFFTCGVHWVYHAIRVYGGAPFLLSITLTALLVLVLSFIFSTPAYLVNKLFKNSSSIRRLTMLYPSTFVVFEWLRGHLIFTGFPWLLIGYSQTSTWFSSLAPVIGVYGLSFIVYFISGCVVTLFSTIPRHQQKMILAAPVCIGALSLYCHFQHYTTLKATKTHLSHWFKETLNKAWKFTPPHYKIHLISISLTQSMHSKTVNLMDL